jgi:hypothetical protein
MADPGKTPATAAPAAVAAPGKAPSTMALGASSRAPAGYRVVTSGLLTALTGRQTRGSVTCPAGTVPFGGGAFISGSNENININSSFPSGTSWFADINNVSGSSDTFSVYAVCANALRKYQIVESSPFANPADTQSSGSVTCPGRTVPLGGGALSQSGSVAVNMNTTIPFGRGWRTDMNNNTTPATTFEVFAVCARQPRNYTVVTGTPVTNPGFTQTLATATCPAPTVPLGGGAFSGSSSPAVDLNTTFPSGNNWDVYEDNTAIGSTSLTAYAVCAT